MEGILRIYGDIGYDWWNDVDNTAITIVSKIDRLKTECNSIKALINSVGGGLYDGLPVFNSLKNCGMPVHTIVEGCAMSMSGIIVQAGTLRSMCRSSILHIHSPMDCTCGNAYDLRRVADELDVWEKPLIAAIASRCGKPTEEVKDLWFDGKDHYFSPEEALAAGLIDSIYDADAQFPEGIAPEGITDMALAEVRDIYAKAYNKKDRGLFSFFSGRNTKNQKPKNEMDKKRLCASLGISPTATDQEIMDAIAKLKNAPKNEASQEEQPTDPDEKEIEEQVEEAKETAEEAKETAEDTQEELEILKEKVETLEQEKETLTEELAAYKNKSNRGGGARIRSDFSSGSKGAWDYAKKGGGLLD